MKKTNTFIMKKFILPSLVSVMLLVPQPSFASSRRYSFNELWYYTIAPGLYSIGLVTVMITAMHLTLPTPYRGEGKRRQ